MLSWLGCVCERGCCQLLNANRDVVIVGILQLSDRVARASEEREYNRVSGDWMRENAHSGDAAAAYCSPHSQAQHQDCGFSLPHSLSRSPGILTVTSCLDIDHKPCGSFCPWHLQCRNAKQNYWNCTSAAVRSDINNSA